MLITDKEWGEYKMALRNLEIWTGDVASTTKGYIHLCNRPVGDLTGSDHDVPLR